MIAFINFRKGIRSSCKVGSPPLTTTAESLYAFYRENAEPFPFPLADHIFMDQQVRDCDNRDSENYSPIVNTADNGLRIIQQGEFLQSATFS